MLDEYLFEADLRQSSEKLGREHLPIAVVSAVEPLIRPLVLWVNRMCNGVRFETHYSLNTMMDQYHRTPL